MGIIVSLILVLLRLSITAAMMVFSVMLWAVLTVGRLVFTAAQQKLELTK